MISNLARPSVAFKANEITPARISYNARMEQISQIAQNQSNVAANPSVKNVQQASNNQIAMQGSAQGQKLDVIA